MKLKITCYTPKGKAEPSSKSFGMKYFHAMQKPIETKIVNKSQFYYIYSYEKEKDMMKVINKKIPKAEQSIRNFYIIVIKLVEKGNKIGKQGAWTIERTKRWILKQFKRKGGNPKEMKDFIDAINLEDKEEMEMFLSGKLFDYKILEEQT